MSEASMFIKSAMGIGAIALCGGGCQKNQDYDDSTGYMEIIFVRVTGCF